MQVNLCNKVSYKSKEKINKFHLPQSAAHKISELNLFLYFLISGVSLSTIEGCTLTLILDPLLWASLSNSFLRLPPAWKPKAWNDADDCCLFSAGWFTTACWY